MMIMKAKLFRLKENEIRLIKYNKMYSKNIKILLVEDDKFMSEIYQRKLSESGFKVKLVQDGAKAVESFLSFEPDLVLLDVMLPKKSGWDILKEIRQIDKNNESKIIMLTNLGEKEKIQQAIDIGADDYLVKSSLTPTELVEIIKNKINPI